MTIHALQRIRERAPKDNPSLVLSVISRLRDKLPVVTPTAVEGKVVHFYRTPRGVPLFPVFAYGAIVTVLEEGMQVSTSTGAVTLTAPSETDLVEDPKVEPMADGIYFDLPDADYHAIPRLSMSGIQKMLVSPADFWASSWLNPRRDDPDADPTAAQITGRAYHTARFEPHLFDARYVRDLDKADMPNGTLFTDTEISEKLAELGLPKTQKGERVLDKAIRLIDAGYEGKVWHYEQAIFEEVEARDKIKIRADIYDQILIDVAALQSSPEVVEYLHGGCPEVSILWTCPDSGVQMKARIDYLRPTGFTDFKTFDNAMGKSLDNLISSAFQYNRYYIQAVGYFQACEMIRAGALDVVGSATDEQRQLIEAIRANKRHMTVHYVWQQKGGVPNVLLTPVWLHARPQDADPNASGLSHEQYQDAIAGMTGASALHHKGALEISRAKRLFGVYSEVYQPGEEWYPIKPIMDIDDASFSPYWLDTVWGD